MPLQPPVPMNHRSGRDRSFVSYCKPQYVPTSTPEPESRDPKDCSVCLAPQPATLAILQPCRHPLCSSCLTSALNIVGEKDMECAVCKQSVANFNLVMGPGKHPANSKSPAPTLSSASLAEDSQKNALNRADASSKSFAEPLFPSSPGSSNAFEDGNTSNGDLGSAFEFGLDLGELRASTPKLEQQTQDSPWIRSKPPTLPRSARNGEDNVVLRIDNVPWVWSLRFHLLYSILNINITRTLHLSKLPNGCNRLLNVFMSCWTQKGRLLAMPMLKFATLLPLARFCEEKPSRIPE